MKAKNKTDNAAKAVTTEQDALNKIAFCAYEAKLANDFKAATAKEVSEFIRENSAALAKGVPVEFKDGENTVRGTLVLAPCPRWELKDVVRWEK